MNGSSAALFPENAGEKVLVIFIHGFMGNPRLFDEFAETVRQHGCSAESLLLPGHGGSVKDFESSTAEQWQGYVDSEIERLSRGHPNIRLVGHSMGGLLALNAAVHQSEYVRGVFMIASPFKLAVFRLKANITRIKYIFYRKTHPVKIAFLENTGIRFSPRIIFHIIKPFAELRKIMRCTRDVLQDVRVPVTAVYSLSDELTSIKSLEILKSGLSGAQLTQITLLESLHAYFPESERVKIAQALIKSLGV